MPYEKGVERRTGFLNKIFSYTCPKCKNIFFVHPGERVFVNYCVDCGYKLWKDWNTEDTEEER